LQDGTASDAIVLTVPLFAYTKSQSPKRSATGLRLLLLMLLLLLLLLLLLF
jgi:hypothetical protein